MSIYNRNTMDKQVTHTMVGLVIKVTVRRTSEDQTSIRCCHEICNKICLRGSCLKIP